MTVQTELRRVVQTGNGATSTFYFNAPVLGLDDLDVYTVTTAAVQTLQTRGGAGTFDYTMTINASTKYATVTLNNNLTNGFKIVMLRSTAITQGVDYVEGDPFLAETHEGALDRLTLIATQLQEQIDRSVKVVETSTTTGITVQELSANAVLVVNAGATGFEMGPTPSSITASATAAAASASAAASSASAASTSASNASTSASNASTSAGSASTSATSATASASSATSSASAASTSATNAAASASTATTQATNAATSASGASTSATNAAASAATATTQATNAANSATASANSATSAAASAASAAALLDNFDDRYLGAKASDPALDNDGNALVTGALYFNTTDGVMKVYTASGWIAASSASVATLATFEFVATSGQTVFTGADANSATLSYVAPALIVTLNGVRLRPGDDYTATNGTSITLVSAAALNDELVVDAFGSFLVANTYTIAQTDAGFVAKTSATGAANLPSGTTGQRPGSPSAGQTRFNSTIGFAEYYTGTQWVNYGNISTPSITYLLVAGGGGGGGSGGANSAAGGGGAGGLLASTTSVSAGTSYSITIGAGGSGGTASNDNFSATSGGNTTAFSLTAVGGGSAPNSNNQSNTSPRNGGSGAGGTGNPSSSTGYPGTGTAGQGNAGGTSEYNSNYPGGGGGGAGAAGGNATPTVAANGGVGVSNSITGTAVFYAGGGGGGIYGSASFSSGGNGGGGNGGGNGTTPGGNATANTGGGGGGTGGHPSTGTNQAGGNGGSGICIVSYPASYKDAVATGTYTKTEAGGNTIYTFTGSGTITF